MRPQIVDTPRFLMTTAVITVPPMSTNQLDYYHNGGHSTFTQRARQSQCPLFFDHTEARGITSALAKAHESIGTLHNCFCGPLNNISGHNECATTNSNLTNHDKYNEYR